VRRTYNKALTRKIARKSFETRSTLGQVRVVAYLWLYSSASASAPNSKRSTETSLVGIVVRHRTSRSGIWGLAAAGSCVGVTVSQMLNASTRRDTARRGAARWRRQGDFLRLRRRPTTSSRELWTWDTHLRSDNQELMYHLHVSFNIFCTPLTVLTTPWKRYILTFFKLNF